MRASIADSEARRMKMGDGGYRIAYNIQFASGIKTKVIYSAGVVNTLDPGTLLPMMLDTHSRLDIFEIPPPKNWLADSAYSGADDIEAATQAFPACTVLAPPKVNKNVDPTSPKKGDWPAVIAWRNRLESEEMKELYKERSSTAEFINAQTKKKGMTEFFVRGLRKVYGMANLHAIAHNVTRYWDLVAAKPLESATGDLGAKDRELIRAFLINQLSGLILT